MAYAFCSSDLSRNYNYNCKGDIFMYDLIQQILNLELTGDDRQLVISICGCLIIIFAVTFIDMIYRLLRSICKKGEF